MSDAEIAARLIEALSEAAGEGAALVSVEITMLAPAAPGEIKTTLTRKTKTLLFMSAELTGEAGARIAGASSVHKTTPTRG